jgi:photosystem II stability/assembly factor-like uncharacterized protein
VKVCEERTLRALAWIGLAALGTLVAGVIYLKPSLAPPVATNPAASARVATSGSAWRLVSASFGDANRGTVLFGSGQAPTTTFLTSDGGKTWRLAVRAPGNGYAAAVFLDTRTVVAQIVSSLGPGPAVPIETRISHDAGRTWRRLPDPRHNPGLGWPGFLDAQHGWWIDRVSSPDPHTPVAIWRTSDGGSTWQELVASGLPATGVPGLPVFIDPLHGAMLFTSRDATQSAVATSDGGESSRAVKAPEVTVQATRLESGVLLRHGHRLLFWLLAVAPQGGIFIDYMPFVSVSDDGLWISEDDGATWAARLMQAPAELRLAMLISAGPGALYATAEKTGPVPIGRPVSPGALSIVGTPPTLIRSTDAGAHWSVVALPRPPEP